jgi:RNA polymerase-binding transcription factor DksA
MRIGTIRSRLLERRTELLARYYGELERAAEENESRNTEDVEKASEQWDARVLARMSDSDALALGRIIGALQRLIKGTYGRCVECGLAIEPSRLHVLPEAETCYECACDAEGLIRAAR